MMQASRYLSIPVMMLIAAVVIGGTAPDAMGQQQRIRYRTLLINVGANPLAKAEAKYEQRIDRMKFDVEGENLAAEFTAVDVFVNGGFITSETVDAFGRFSVDMDSRDGDIVPAIVLGDIVDVFDQTTGILLFTGEMRNGRVRGGGTTSRTNLTGVDVNLQASAYAEYEVRSDRRKFKVEGQRLGPEFLTVEIMVNGDSIGTAALNVQGEFSLELDSRFQPVPLIVDGDLVEVFDADTGALLFIGQMSL